MKRPLTQHLLTALRRELPLLIEWEPELHSTHRPVLVETAKHPADAETRLALTLGRYCNTPTWEYHSGCVSAFLAGNNGPRSVVLDEGVTLLGDLIASGDQVIIIKTSHRSELVGNDPGHANYTIYLRAGVTLQQARDTARRQAQELVARLG